MKALHLTKTASGGAGVAAKRTVAALRGAGVDATLWCEGSVPALGPASGTLRRWWLNRLDSIPTRLHWRRRRFSAWSNNWRATSIASAINAVRPDVVHFHWMGQGFFSFDEMEAVDAPVVWTMHDAWPFTGGCHYPADCVGYTASCGHCPQLSSQKRDDLSARNWRVKERSLSRVARWIAPSRWLADCAARSPLIRAERLRVIPNALDTGEWRPVDRAEARRSLGLSENAFVMVGGAMDLREPRKAGRLLLDAFERIGASDQSPVVLVLFGSGTLPQSAAVRGHIRFVGRVESDARLAQVYSAADLVVMPSLQDNLPNVVMEALACGCPVVGLDSGGIREMIEDGRTGLLAAEKTSSALAEAVAEWRRRAPARLEVSQRCREHVSTLYSPARHARSLMSEYSALQPAPASS